MAEKMMVTLAESGHPVFRATSPLSRGQLKSKGGGKLSIHYCADQDTITTVFRTITSVTQLSLYGAVAEMCEENESFHDRTGTPVVGGQASSSLVLSAIKTEVPLDCDDRAHKDLLMQKDGRTSIWKTKQITIERGDPLFAVTQITSAQCLTRLTSTSEYPDCHILL